MPKLYYLFSETSENKSINKKEFREAIYVCDDGEFIENADYRTGVYPMGTFLSKTTKLLTSWTEKGSSPYKWQKSMESISETQEHIPENVSSFSNLIQDDPATDMVFRLLTDYKYMENIHPRRNNDVFYKLLTYYLNYIELCQEDSIFSSIKELNSLIYQVNDSFPEHSTYITDRINNHEILTKNNIKNVLLNINLINHVFAPPLKRRKNKLFSLPLLSFHSIKKTKWGELKTPLEVFHITDITDLILASLYCIFQQKYILRKCAYCKGPFITCDKKRKYCPNMSDEEKNCYIKHRSKRQLKVNGR